MVSWTAGEIHFKINPNPNGTTPYEFFASQCKSLTFIHRNINKDESSSYSGFIETINYNLNSDSDSSFQYDYLDLDSDDDLCNDLTEAGFADKDPDGDGIMGEGQPTFDNGKIDSRGKYKDHSYPDPLKDIDNLLYLFQKAGSSVSITKQPDNITECEDRNVSFEVSSGNPTPSNATVSYKWQLFNSNNNTWSDLNDDTTYSGVNTNKLTLTGINNSMSGNKFRVNVNTNEYICGIDSDEVTLDVVATPKKPNVPPIQIYCFDNNNQPKVSQLTITEPDSTLTVKWFENELGGTEIDPNTEPVSYTHLTLPTNREV